VGTYRDANEKRHGFIWRNGVFITTSINVPNDDPVLGTVAFGINDVGAVREIMWTRETTFATASCGAAAATSRRSMGPARF
jgi:hypothetical protein